MPTIINAQRITKAYRDKESGLKTLALGDVSLSIEGGDFVAIAGPSGSGKTTLLNILGGLDRPDQGDVMIDTTNLSTLDSAKLSDFRLRHIGFVFQAYNLIPTLTAAENAEYVSMLQNTPSASRRQHVARLFEELGIAACLKRRPAELSGGQQQRVAVARAILAAPKIVFADEPTANLDSATGAALIELMRKLNQERGITFVFATHDPMVMERAKTLVRMKDGKVII